MSKKHVSFEHYERQIKIPFIIYAHFDSIQIRTESKIVHQPCGFGYSVKCSFDQTLSKYEDYFGEDSPTVFWQKLEAEVGDIVEKLTQQVDHRVLNDEEKRLFEKIDLCYFCGRQLGEDRFEDFYPLTGQFLGAAHKECIQRRKVPEFIPIVMHNFAKYGSHFLMKGLSEEDKKKIFVVGKDQGFIRNLPLIALKFIDLKQFVIDEKIQDLEKILSDSKKRRLKSEFGEKILFDLMKRKNFFPYYHVDSFDKFDDPLPNEKGFFDQLHDEDISEENYNRCLDIWECFGCRNTGDYFRIYLKSCTFLLEDIFENFRSLCLDKYHLDLAHYFTIASFAWDSMLKYTGVELELLQDQSMIHLIKSNIRGGITQCSKRHAKANNKYCGYDKHKPPSFIVYLDANNLGGWAMSQKLPFSDFTWLNKTEIRMISDKITTLEEESDYGYILEVDLEYPKELHPLHNDLPFCLERLLVPPSPKSHHTVERSVLNFYNKSKYVIEYRTLKQCLQHGLVLTNIHRVLRFRQRKWLEPYIAYNTTLRAQAENDFEVKLYKLLNNSVYGKTIQKTSTDKPIYAGFSIVELSKKFMYEFHYNFMVPKYQNKINLLYIDTDGVIYEIQTFDYFEDLKSDPHFLSLMDTSNLDSRWNIPRKNKKMIGKMKDEYNGKIIREFFGVGAKVYFLDVEGEEVKKAVGMKKYVKAKYIHREDYEKCVLQDKRITRAFSETSSEEDVVQSRKIRKVVLSPSDNKRFVLSDKINTLSLGYQM